jgi:hypothetical protein
MTTMANVLDKTYWIGKDQRHAQDERDINENFLQTKNLENVQNVNMTDLPYHDDMTDRVSPNCVNFTTAILFRLPGSFGNHDDRKHYRSTHSQLLVMQTCAINYSNFRILDLKLGPKNGTRGMEGKISCVQTPLDGRLVEFRCRRLSYSWLQWLSQNI